MGPKRLSGDNKERRGFRVGRAAAGAVTAAAALMFLGWLGWTGIGMRDEMRAASQSAMRVVELCGTIASLNASLTMSAQIAAATGEPRWTDRYDETAPQLDAAIGEAIGLATPDVRAAFTSTTGEAHRDLVTMERRAFALAAEGDLTAARALMNSPEFNYLEDVYATGIEVFAQQLKTLADKRAAAMNDRAWMEAAGLALSVILLIATALTLRGHARLQGALAHTAAVARTDPLTGLPNRRQFFEELEALSRDGPGISHALLLIDLDRFKAANDAYGHPAGDEVLKLVAARLRAIGRSGDLVARLGGDEFAMIVKMETASPAGSSGDPAATARRIVSALGEPLALAKGAKVQIGASVGIALGQPGGDAVSLMHQADVALYRAKGDGRSCLRYFEQGMDEEVRARALMEGELRQAISEGTILPYFQPLVEMTTGWLVGVEMLARWPHPTRGTILPAKFIPIAEDLGLIGPLTEHLMRQSCLSARSWPDHLTLACNISPTQLRDQGLPSMVSAVLQETGFPAHRLELEVTESALMGDIALARTLLNEVKALGVRLALDDFGTGYSSLRHLQTLPFDKLKIDASFVGAMTSDKESWKIVAAVIGLGQSLGLTTVAEGVETAETAAQLRSLGCIIGQGWLFGRPGPAETIEQLTIDPIVIDLSVLAKTNRVARRDPRF